MKDMTLPEFLALALIIGGLYLSLCWILVECFTVILPQYFGDDEQD